MRLADVMELPIDSALEQREERLDCVGVVKAACPNVFVSRMVDGSVPRKLAAEPRIDHCLVRHQVRLPANLRDDRFAQGLGRDIGDVLGASFSVALNNCENGFLLWGRTKRLVASL